MRARPRRDDQLAIDHGSGQWRSRPGVHAVRRRLHGGSLMLDWELYRPEGEWDLEIRYSHIKLESLDSTSSGVEGKALARSLGVWGRYRAPTGKTVFDRPLRYVLEVAGSNYYGDTRRCPRLRSPVVARCRHRVRYQQVRHDHRAHPLGPAPAHRPRRRRPVARHCRELLSMRACSLTPQHGQLTNRPGQAAAAHADEGTDKAVGYWACHRGLVAR